MSSTANPPPPSEPPERPRVERILAAACLAAAAAICIPALPLLSRIWQQSEYFGHGYLIPMVSVLLLYANRKQIARALRTGRAPALGFVAVFLAASLEALAVSSQVATVAGAGIPLLLLAAAWAVGGRDLFRATGLPVAFLLMMVPPPGFVTDSILVDLKLIVTRAAVSILHVFEVTIAATGNQIHVPGYELFVADACTGLNSIVTLIPLGVIVAYFLSRGIWRRLLVVASIVPLAVAANIVRVIVTVLAVDRVGIEVAEGWLHEGFGVTTFVVGTLALVALAWLLGGPGEKPVDVSPRDEAGPDPVPAIPAPGRTSSRLRLLFVVFALLLPGTTLAFWVLGDPAGQRFSTAGLPETVGEYTVDREQALDRTALELLEPAAYTLRLYTREDGGPAIWVYVALYPGRGAKGAHDPKVCYPSQGWDVNETEELEVERPEGESLTVQFLSAYQAGADEIALYWFQPAGRWPRSTWLENLLRPLDSLSGVPQYGFVRLSIRDVDTVEGRAALEEFASGIAPAVRSLVEDGSS